MIAVGAEHQRHRYAVIMSAATESAIRPSLAQKAVTFRYRRWLLPGARGRR
jgi:hypothetical protein